jgi:phage FluMu gp28-like protein
MPPVDRGRLIEYLNKSPLNQIRLNTTEPELVEEALKEDSIINQLQDDPVFFSRLMLGIKPTQYQEEFLKSNHKRILVRWPRQSGKTRTLGQLAIWHASLHRDQIILLVAPSERQSINLRDEIHKLLGYMPQGVRKTIVKEMRRTRIYFRNGSKIVALPNSEETIRGFKAHVIMIDEAAFFRNDESILRHVMIPMLATTGGRLILSSTPWGKGTLFHRLSLDPSYQQFHISWETAYEEGVYAPEFKQEILKTQENNPLAYETEYLAEFAEESNIWLSTQLLTNAINPALELKPYNKPQSGNYYMGVDLAERVDHSAIAVIDRAKELNLLHLQKFPLGEPLTSVIGYAKVLASNWEIVHACYIDSTKHGDHITNDFKASGLPAYGVTFTHKNKMHMAELLKSRISDSTLSIPYNREILSELNTPTFHLTKQGTIQYDHPLGTHDDIFWAIALAVLAAEENRPKSIPMARIIR